MNFVCALLPEAKPLIQELGLSKQKIDSPFSLFKNESHQLVVSGIGKQNIATAIGFLHGLAPSKNTAWLNVGLAGHGNAQLGTPVQIIKSTDHSTQKSYYPPPIFSTKLEKSVLLTYDQPSSEYQPDTAYDMEGSAFFATASRFCTRELVQSVKIISDNPQSPVSKFDKSSVSSLITPAIPLLNLLITEMEEIAGELSPSFQLGTTFQKIARLHSLSQTQEYQVQKIIRQADLFALAHTEIISVFSHSTNLKSALKKANQLLEEKRLFP